MSADATIDQTRRSSELDRLLYRSVLLTTPKVPVLELFFGAVSPLGPRPTLSASPPPATTRMNILRCSAPESMPSIAFLRFYDFAGDNIMYKFWNCFCTLLYTLSPSLGNTWRSHKHLQPSLCKPQPTGRSRCALFSIWRPWQTSLRTYDKNHIFYLCLL